MLLRLDYISCVLTVLSTILVGRRLWHGWIVAGANSLLICIIGARTAQTGFIPANLFCLGIYGYNVLQWRQRAQEDREPPPPAASPVNHTRFAKADVKLRRILHRLPHRDHRASHAPLKHQRRP